MYKEHEDKAIKQKLGTNETNLNEDNIGKRKQATEEQKNKLETFQRGFCGVNS